MLLILDYFAFSKQNYIEINRYLQKAFITASKDNMKKIEKLGSDINKRIEFLKDDSYTNQPIKNIENNFTIVKNDITLLNKQIRTESNITLTNNNEYIEFNKIQLHQENIDNTVNYINNEFNQNKINHQKTIIVKDTKSEPVIIKTDKKGKNQKIVKTQLKGYHLTFKQIEFLIELNGYIFDSETKKEDLEDYFHGYLIRFNGKKSIKLSEKYKPHELRFLLNELVKKYFNS